MGHGGTRSGLLVWWVGVCCVCLKNLSICTCVMCGGGYEWIDLFEGVGKGFDCLRNITMAHPLLRSMCEMDQESRDAMCRQRGPCALEGRGSPCTSTALQIGSTGVEQPPRTASHSWTSLPTSARLSSLSTCPGDRYRCVTVVPLASMAGSAQSAAGSRRELVRVQGRQGPAQGTTQYLRACAVGRPCTQRAPIARPCTQVYSRRR